MPQPARRLLIWGIVVTVLTMAPEAVADWAFLTRGIQVGIISNFLITRVTETGQFLGVGLIGASIVVTVLSRSGRGGADDGDVGVQFVHERFGSSGQGTVGAATVVVERAAEVLSVVRK